jgi:predicted nucleic acid-binding protein
VIVVDASVLATALGDDGPDGDRARARLRGERLSAPQLVDLEVTSVLRRQVQGGEVDTRRAALALADLAAMPLRRAPHRPLLARCWELRDNLTIYDASYVALAEALDITLLTGDGRLARAPGPRCRVEMLRPASLPQLLQASSDTTDSAEGRRLGQHPSDATGSVGSRQLRHTRMASLCLWARRAQSFPQKLHCSWQWVLGDASVMGR